ncbi:MAG: hypothetical protein AAF828_06235, partial [Bacteroidota bacterium]
MNQPKQSKEEAIRAKILHEGAIALELELERKVEYATTVQEKFDIPSRKILSNALIVNRDLPKNIRRELDQQHTNLRNIIIGTASFIEKNKFSTVIQAIKAVD